MNDDINHEKKKIMSKMNLISKLFLFKYNTNKYKNLLKKIHFELTR